MVRTALTAKGRGSIGSQGTKISQLLTMAKIIIIIMKKTVMFLYNLAVPL